MKGAYILIIKLEKPEEIIVGRLGRLLFRRGFYAYVGSAMNGIEQRVSHHLKREKNLHWHIDYLLKKGKMTDVLVAEGTKSLECVTAQGLGARLDSVKGFGCSDCRCKSHLFYSESREALVTIIKKFSHATFTVQR